MMVIRKGKTKDKILVAALHLFAVNGYDAVGVEDIAAAVEIRPPSLYNHYKSKAAIVDEILYRVEATFAKKSIYQDGVDFSKADEEMLFEMAKKHIMMLQGDPILSSLRKFFMIEQFRNPRIREMQIRYAHIGPSMFGQRLIKNLVAAGRIKPVEDIEYVAFKLTAAVSVIINRCDTDPDYFDKGMELLRKHICDFWAEYKA